MVAAAGPHVVIVNRNYPPRPGVTGESACVLADYLTEQHGVKVSVVTVRSAYAGGTAGHDPVGDVHEISSLYDGKNKVLRLFASLIESARLIRKAKRIKGSTIVVMTDPPFLSTCAALGLRKHHWGLYSMDLYPDAFVSGNLTSRQNILYRLLRTRVYGTPPAYLIALGPLQASFLTEQYGCSIPTAVLPCGVFEPTQCRPPKWKRDNDGKIIVGYCGNLGEAHSVEFLAAVIRHLDPDRFHLVLSLYGSRAAEVLSVIDDTNPGITLVDSVSRSELSFIDVHLVSLLSEWAHVCVPSKAVSAVCSGGAFLFCGTPDCDNWHLLGDAGWIIDESNDHASIDKQVQTFFETVRDVDIAEKRKQTEGIRRDLLSQSELGHERVAEIVANAPSCPSRLVD